MCCIDGDELQFVNIFCANTVVILCSADILYRCYVFFFNIITATIQVTKDRMSASPGLDYGPPCYSTLQSDRCLATFRLNLPLHLQGKKVYIVYSGMLVKL